jgi:2-desacetyl-2-hydroxyethyl bacteriochlorophyllide A dehydrogenase
MKAIKLIKYGPPEVLQLVELEKPTPDDKELLIKVYATPISFGDVKTRDFTFPLKEFWLPAIIYPMARLAMGYKKPKKQVLGSEFAGKVESVGSDVKLFKEGDEVFGYVGPSFGANAEYLCVPENGLVTLKPSNMNYEEASAVPFNSMIAFQFIKKAKIQKGEKVLIVGASGGIGQFAVQLAKDLGAEVTGVCSTTKLEFVKSIGADEVIDYTKEDFSNNGETYDVIFHTARKSSFSRDKKSLNPNGRYVTAVFGMKEVFQMLFTKMKNKKVICGFAPTKLEDLIYIKELVEAGKIKSVIDKSYPLEEIVEAHEYVEKGLKKGNVVIKITSDT